MSEPEATPTPEIPEEEVKIPEDLENQLKSLQAVSETHNLLSQGTFPYKMFQSVDGCLGFLRSMHNEGLKRAIEHKDSDLVPELKEFKERQTQNAVKEAAKEPSNAST